MTLRNYLGHSRCHKCGRPESEGEGWRHHRATDGSIYYSLHETCPEKVCKRPVFERGTRSVSSHPCSKDAKGQDDKGEWLCGRHLAGFNRRKKNDAARLSKKHKEDHNKERANTAIAILAELGVKASLDYAPFDHHYTGNIVIDPAEVLRIAGIGYQLPEKDIYKTD